MKPYAVVEFIDDCSVDVVPSVWLEGDKHCSWPPYRKERLLAAIKKCEAAVESWSKFSVRVLHSFGK